MADNVRPKFYRTDHFLSQHVGHHVCQGFDAQSVPPVALLPGLAIVYGILRGCGDIMKAAEEAKQDYLYIDHSFFKQTRSNADEFGYYRCIKNGRYHHPIADMPSDRFEQLDIELKPWRTHGDHIVVVPISTFVAEYEGIDGREWLRRTVATLVRFTQRDIIIKPKDTDQSLAETLKNAHALVCLDSNAATEAIISGIPVFCSKQNAAAPVADEVLNMIETPQMPHREQWAYNLAYQQFTLAEIASGYAKKVLYD